MTEAEFKVELGAAEEESTTEAAPKGLESPPSPLQPPEGAPSHGAGSSAGGATGFSTIYPTLTSFPPFS